jgi:hypothetical protein
MKGRRGEREKRGRRRRRRGDGGRGKGEAQASRVRYVKGAVAGNFLSKGTLPKVPNQSPDLRSEAFLI